MYKYYKKDSYKVMEYDFFSIIEFLNYLDTQPINRDIFRNDLASESNDYYFTKTRSLEEAKQLLKYGCHENFDKILELKLKLEKYIKMSKIKQRQYNYYVGYAPDVKAYLEGCPLSMLNKEQPKRKQINIYYNAAILGNVSVEEIFNRGAITLCLVEILENMGFGVGLNIFTMSKSENQIHYAKFNIKSSAERLNMQKVFFPLCHPSFLRRLVFRLREMTPDIEYHWYDGYGKTCDDYTIRNIINLKSNDIVVCQPSEMGVLGTSIVDDANRMFEYINSFKDRDFVLEKIIDDVKYTKRR